MYSMKGIPILSHQWYRINKYSSIAFMMVFRILTDAVVNDPFYTGHSFTSVVAQTQFRTGATIGVRLRYQLKVVATHLDR